MCPVSGRTQDKPFVDGSVTPSSSTNLMVGEVHRIRATRNPLPNWKVRENVHRNSNERTSSGCFGS